MFYDVYSSNFYIAISAVFDPRQVNHVTENSYDAEIFLPHPFYRLSSENKPLTANIQTTDFIDSSLKIILLIHINKFESCNYM